MIDRIKEIRKKLFKTQSEFATFLGVSPQAIGKYEQGLTVITTNNIKQLIDVYKINPLWLFTGNGSMFLDEKDDSVNVLKENRTLKKENEHLKIENNLLKELIKK